MAKNKSALKGSEHLTMGDQMLAQRVSAKQTTSPTTGAVENPRRKFLKNKIEARVQAFATKQRRDSGSGY